MYFIKIRFIIKAIYWKYISNLVLSKYLFNFKLLFEFNIENYL